MAKLTLSLFKKSSDAAATDSQARSRKWLQWLFFAAVIAAGLVAGTLLAPSLREKLTAPTSEQYDVETARDVTRSNTTDSFIQLQQAKLNKNSDDVQANENLGIAFLQKARETGDPGYYTKAEGLLQRALTLNPNDSNAMSALGSLALSRHAFSQTLDWGERARAINPYDAHNYGVIGDAQIELGRYDEAVKTFQKMVDLRPDLSSYSRVSYARELYGDLDGAASAMQQAVAAGGPNAENTNWSRVQLGNLYFNHNRLDLAEHEYQAALYNYPNYVHALAGIAKVRAARGKYDEAIDDYTQAIEIIPLPEYVIALGDLYAYVGKSAEATRMHNLVRFEADLFRANGVDVDLELALFDADHGQNLDQALTRARDAYAKRPSIHAADVLAWTLFHTGHYDEAQKFMQEALRLGTEDALMYYHAARIAYQLNDVQTATDELQKAVSLNPHFSILYADTAAQWLDALRSGQHPVMP